MFQFGGFASLARCPESFWTGCPIRTFAGQFVFADHRNFSQLVTSFIASGSQGIHLAPFFHFLSFPSYLYDCRFFSMSMCFHTCAVFEDIVLRVQEQDFLCLTCLQKGGVPAAPSGTATLLRLSPSHLSYPWPLLAVTDFRYPRLPWLDGRCVQGPGTYSPRRG